VFNIENKLLLTNQTKTSYGTDAISGKQYWIMRNQWGSEWGESGYMRLQKNAGNQICVATEMYMPVLSSSTPTG